MPRSSKYPTGGRKLAPKRGRKPSKATGPFARWIKATGKTLAEIALLLSAGDDEFSHQSVTNLRAGRTKPSLDRALRIEAVSLGAVPANSWQRRGVHP